MSDSVADLLGGLDGRQVPLLAKVTGRARLDLVDGTAVEPWSIAIHRGDVTVTHEGGPADCTIRAERTVFERLCRGEENAMAAVLRGAVVCGGDVEILLAIQRVFPGPPRSGAPAGGEGAR